MPFPRLVNALADYACSSGARVWVQHGAAKLTPPLEGVSLLPREDLLAKVRAADVVVTHAGCGSISDAFHLGHVPVVVPRLARHEEHVNDHQLELVDVLSAEDRIVAVHDVAELPGAIMHAAGRRRPNVDARAGQALREALAHEVGQNATSPSPRTIIMWALLRLATTRVGLRRAARQR